MNGVQERGLRIDREIWKVLTVYNGGIMKKLKKVLERMELERGKKRIFV